MILLSNFCKAGLTRAEAQERFLQLGPNTAVERRRAP
jgi:hypothetical protein